MGKAAINRVHSYGLSPVASWFHHNRHFQFNWSTEFLVDISLSQPRKCLVAMVWQEEPHLGRRCHIGDAWLFICKLSTGDNRHSPHGIPDRLAGQRPQGFSPLLPPFEILPVNKHAEAAALAAAQVNPDLWIACLQSVYGAVDVCLADHPSHFDDEDTVGFIHVHFNHSRAPGSAAFLLSMISPNLKSAAGPGGLGGGVPEARLEDTRSGDEHSGWSGSAAANTAASLDNRENDEVPLQPPMML